MVWRPKRGATSSAEEFTSARTLFIALHNEARWNPWVLEDRAAEVDSAKAVMEQWTRAEPNFRRPTAKRFEARMARWDRDDSAKRAKVAARRERDRARYDPDRENARLVLLEDESRLQYELREVAALRDHSGFPAMTEARRGEEVAEIETRVAWLRADIDRLTTLVGDREQVVDEQGWLPQDRRELVLSIYSSRRCVEVHRIRPSIPELTVFLTNAESATERAERRGRLKAATGRFEKLLAIPELTAADMCSECATPASSHGWSTPPSDGPCPAWPRWAARVKEARQMLDSFARPSRTAESPMESMPKPLAVIPSRLPISDIVTRLAEIQQAYPDAEVRRGSANRWEIWPRNDPATDVSKGVPQPVERDRDDASSRNERGDSVRS